MENLKEKINYILISTEELYSALASAKSLVDDGKEVKCSRKLQGAIVKVIGMVERLQDIYHELASENNKPTSSN